MISSNRWKLSISTRKICTVRSRETCSVGSVHFAIITDASDFPNEACWNRTSKQDHHADQADALTCQPGHSKSKAVPLQWENHRKLHRRPWGVGFSGPGSLPTIPSFHFWPLECNDIQAFFFFFFSFFASRNSPKPPGLSTLLKMMSLRQYLYSKEYMGSNSPTSLSKCKTEASVLSKQHLFWIPNNCMSLPFNFFF